MLKIRKIISDFLVFDIQCQNAFYFSKFFYSSIIVILYFDFDTATFKMFGFLDTHKIALCCLFEQSNTIIISFVSPP